MGELHEKQKADSIKKPPIIPSSDYLRMEARNCEDCNIFFCPEQCFNAHPNSMIALGKLLRGMGKDKGEVHVIKER